MWYSFQWNCPPPPVTKVTFLVNQQNQSVIVAQTSMEYHGVLPNVFLSRMSVYAYNLAWKKMKYENIMPHHFDGMSLREPFAKVRAEMWYSFQWNCGGGGGDFNAVKKLINQKIRV